MVAAYPQASAEAREMILTHQHRATPDNNMLSTGDQQTEARQGSVNEPTLASLDALQPNRLSNGQSLLAGVGASARSTELLATGGFMPLPS
jgi:hypothetical protein